MSWCSRIITARIFRHDSRLTQADTRDRTRREALGGELTRLETELARYAEAIAAAGPLDTLRGAIRSREERREAISRELKSLGTP